MYTGPWAGKKTTAPLWKAVAQLSNGGDAQKNSMKPKAGAKV
jgi:hypothetical protein